MKFKLLYFLIFFLPSCGIDLFNKRPTDYNYYYLYPITYKVQQTIPYKLGDTTKFYFKEDTCTLVCTKNKYSLTQYYISEGDNLYPDKQIDEYNYDTYQVILSDLTNPTKRVFLGYNTFFSQYSGFYIEGNLMASEADFKYAYNRFDTSNLELLKPNITYWDSTTV